MSMAGHRQRVLKTRSGSVSNINRRYPAPRVKSSGDYDKRKIVQQLTTYDDSLPPPSNSDPVIESEFLGTSKGPLSGLQKLGSDDSMSDDSSNELGDIYTGVSKLEGVLKSVQDEVDSLLAQRLKVEETLLILQDETANFSADALKKEQKRRRKLHRKLTKMKKEKRRIEKKVVEIEEVVFLNVGGIIHCTSRSTLVSGNHLLAKMFSGKYILPRDEEGNYFIDRDGKLFRYILNYLRTRSLPDLSTRKLHQLNSEAEYFEIASIQSEIGFRLKDYGIYAVLRYNETSSSNHLSWQGATQPCLLIKSNNLFKSIDEVLADVDGKGWKLKEMSGDGSIEGGWMFVFRKEKPDFHISLAAIEEDRIKSLKESRPLIRKKSGSF
eukprot:TRINITY_DN9723_c0_g1_i1.p1 TRINITY_DN9723_c0_g1~~TRINITY_DN9723_c0_g1_i1.p1  ORF type:complete len:394 (-),score=71.85 TRINITY_DN9723_c0_g1_i1:53-1195(-)